MIKRNKKCISESKHDSYAHRRRNVSISYTNLCNNSLWENSAKATIIRIMKNNDEIKTRKCFALEIFRNKMKPDHTITLNLKCLKPHTRLKMSQSSR